MYAPPTPPLPPALLALLESIRGTGVSPLAGLLGQMAPQVTSPMAQAVQAPPPDVYRYDNGPAVSPLMQAASGHGAQLPDSGRIPDAVPANPYHPAPSGYRSPVVTHPAQATTSMGLMRNGLLAQRGGEAGAFRGFGQNPVLAALVQRFHGRSRAV